MGLRPSKMRTLLCEQLDTSGRASLGWLCRGHSQCEDRETPLCGTLGVSDWVCPSAVFQGGHCKTQGHLSLQGAAHSSAMEWELNIWRNCVRSVQIPNKSGRQSDRCLLSIFFHPVFAVADTQLLLALAVQQQGLDPAGRKVFPSSSHRAAPLCSQVLIPWVSCEQCLLTEGNFA